MKLKAGPNKFINSISKIEPILSDKKPPNECPTAMIFGFRILSCGMPVFEIEF